MEIKKVNNSIFNKIQQINYFLFLLIFYFNIWLVLVLNKITINNTYFIIGNFLIMFFFFIINKIYKKEFLKKQNEIDKLLKLDKNWTSWKKEDWIYKLFKRNYIKKNILEKDYLNLKMNFQKFIPDNFLKNISNKWLNEDIEIGLSKEKDLHIMFIDISGFTKISEELTPEKALFLLNIYFDWIVEISRKNWWHVDKFLWDWIMLVFDEQYSDKILQTAIEIRDLVWKINIANFKHKITIWIWINSWKATLWTIWSKDRMDITIIWDSVNIASRIEELTRNEKDWILFSQNTYQLIKNKEKFRIDYIWKKSLKWKSEEIKLYWITKKN